MTECGRIDIINSFTDTVQSCWGSDSEIGHGHIIVDRANQAYNFKVRMGLGLLFGYFAYGKEISRTKMRQGQSRQYLERADHRSVVAILL
jgi:hypothetical protein